MVGSEHLPELPLMVAGIAEPVLAVLRRAGLPIAELPRVALAAEGTGRFLLYDSRSTASVTRMRAARRQGLEGIDLAEIDRSLPGGLWDFEDESAGAATSLKNGPQAFVTQLKLRLESLGGIWLRITEYPYPYRSALAVGVVHGESPVPQPYACGLPLTHFLGSRLREEELRGLWFAEPFELGWAVDGDDVEPTARKSQSRWRTRMDRYRDAGREVGGYRCAAALAGVPALPEQIRLGLRYRAETGRTGEGPGATWDYTKGEQVRIQLDDVARLGTDFSGLSPATVVRLDHEGRRPGQLAPDHVLNSSVIALPSALRPVLLSRIAGGAAFESWFRERVESGVPMFLDVPAELADFPGLQRLTILADDSPFLWRCTFAQFAKWQLARRRACPVVRRTAAGYELTVAPELAAAGLAVELWRGTHVARLPLTESTWSIPEDGLLYQPAEGACPGGTCLPRAKPAPARGLLRRTGSTG